MKRLLGLLLILSWGVLPLLAQDAPSRTQTQAAVLRALGERVGNPNLTLTNISRLEWAYGDYAYVVSLGCAAATARPPVDSRWQRFVLMYQGQSYVYLITDDTSTLLLCNAEALPTLVPSPTAMPPSATPDPLATPVVGGGTSGNILTEACTLPPRLVVGGVGRVTPGDPNWMHESPRRQSGKVGEILGLGLFDVIAGPFCDLSSGMNYWEVQANGRRGYTSEGLNGVYWVEPTTIIQPLNAENARTLQDAYWLADFPQGITQVEYQNGNVWAVLDKAGVVTVYNDQSYSIRNEPIARLERQPAFVEIALDSLAFMLATRQADGTVSLWDVTAQRVIAQRKFDQLTTIELGTGVLLAVATETEVTVWDVNNFGQELTPLATLPTSVPTARLVFTPDGRTLLAYDALGTLQKVWMPVPR